jgi:hypothetical protein
MNMTNASVGHAYDFILNGQAGSVRETTDAGAQPHPGVAGGGGAGEMDQTYTHKESVQVGGFSAE